MLDEPYIQPEFQKSLDIEFQPREHFVATIAGSTDQSVTVNWTTSGEQAVLTIGDSPVVSELAKLPKGSPVVITVEGPPEVANVVSFLRLSQVSPDQQFALV